MVDISKLNRVQRSEKYIKSHYPDIHHIICSYPEDLTWSEKLYWYEHGISTYPVCEVCGKRVSFMNHKDGYRVYCSRECTVNSASRTDKYKSTCMERYGVDNISMLKDIKDKKRETAIKNFGGEGYASDIIKDKSINTCIEKYGTAWAINNPEIKQKAMDTLMKNYGVDLPLQSDAVKQKVKDTCIKRYGVDNYAKTDAGRQMISNTRKSRYSKHTGAVYNDGWWYPCPHPECNQCMEKRFLCESTIYYDRVHLGYETCTILNPKYTGSTGEHTICNWLDKWGIEYVRHNRDILSPKELDIYIPSHHIAIEFNGVYFHSTRSIPDHKYHMNKWKSCKDKGIQLITIWEDQMMTHPEIIKSILRSKLGLCTGHIYARKCEIRHIQLKDANIFLEKNHLQGCVRQGKVCYGAYYNDEIVGVIVFNTRSKVSGGKNDSDTWELVRFCTLLDTNISGLASKMLNIFVNDIHPDTIVSFSSNDISDGGVYKKLGFADDGMTGAYWYIKDLKRYHRSSFSKSSLKRKGYDIEGKTEYDITDNIPGLWRIYDSGHVKWIKHYNG